MIRTVFKCDWGDRSHHEYNKTNITSSPQSIIFIRHFTKGGFEISGYIDYAHRLIAENWAPFFKYGKTLWPRDNDLGYYHWRHGTVRSNISRNYKVFYSMFPS